MIPSNLQAPQSVVLDASVWVSHIISTDRNHTPADAWISNHLRVRAILIAPTLFRVEVAAAISRATKDRQLARQEVGQLRRLNSRSVLRFVPISHTLIQDATDFAVNFGLRAGDAVYAALAQQLNIPLVTFDNELLQLPATTITTIRP